MDNQNLYPIEQYLKFIKSLKIIIDGDIKLQDSQKKVIAHSANVIEQYLIDETLNNIPQLNSSVQTNQIENLSFNLKYNSNIAAMEFYLYSDGACSGNPGPGGWAYLLEDHQGHFILEDSGFMMDTTNNQMELMGAIMGVTKILELLKVADNAIAKPANLINLHLVSDSKYLLDGLTKWMPSWKKKGWRKADNKPPENLSFWVQLDELSSYFNKIDTSWVKGHNNHPQNERCDYLAKKAITQSTII